MIGLDHRKQPGHRRNCTHSHSKEMSLHLNHLANWTGLWPCGMKKRGLHIVFFPLPPPPSLNPINLAIARILLKGGPNREGFGVHGIQWQLHGGGGGGSGDHLLN